MNALPQIYDEVQLPGPVAAQVTPVRLGAYVGFAIVRDNGVSILDFSTYHPYAVYPWPLPEGGEAQVLGELDSLPQGGRP